MDLLFKASSPSTGSTLIKHSNFQNHYPAVHANMAWDSFKPWIRKATRKYLIPWIGNEFYDDIAAKFQSGFALNSEQSETLELLQDAIAYYSVYMAMPFMNVQLTDMGPQQANDREGTSGPPSQWSFKNARWAAILQADSSLDQALRQMLSQIEEDNDYYDLWKDADEFEFGKSGFIRSVGELSEFLNFQDSLRSYKELIKHVFRAESKYLRPVLGSEMYEELVTQIGNNNLSAENARLALLAKKVAAEYGLYEAVPYLTLVVDSDGFKVVSQSDQMDNRRNMTNVSHQRAIEQLRQASENNARTYRADLQQFIYNNVEDYPTFKASSTYTNLSTSSKAYESLDGRGAVYF